MPTGAGFSFPKHCSLWCSLQGWGGWVCSAVMVPAEGGSFCPQKRLPVCMFLYDSVCGTLLNLEAEWGVFSLTSPTYFFWFLNLSFSGLGDTWRLPTNSEDGHMAPVYVSTHSPLRWALKGINTICHLPVCGPDLCGPNELVTALKGLISLR